MKNFNGTIIITDPCYISKKNGDWGNSFNFYDKTINNELGFSEYFFEDTKVGDWTCSTYQTPGYISDIPKYINDIEDAFWKYFKNPTIENELRCNDMLEDSNILGKFCADSGMTGVFYESEILSYNPKFFKNIGNWCYTKIENFQGQIDFISDSYGNKHFYGVGNINFLTISNDI